MAKENDSAKNVSNVAFDKASEKDAEAEKKAEKSDKSKDDKDAKSKKASKKRKKSIVKFFKDARSEFKKVVWPTPKTTTNNTIVVIVVCVLAALFIFGVDSLFGVLNGLILGG